MSYGTMSTGYIKVGSTYINPHSITSIEKAENGDSRINYNEGQYGKSIIACETKPNKVADASIRAMSSGSAVDVYA